MQKSPEHPFRDIGKAETCAKISAKNISLYGVGARQSFKFFRQNT